MSRTNRVLALAAGLALASGAAHADPSSGAYDDRYDQNSDYDFAEVVHVEPLRRQFRVSEPVRECWQETSQASAGPFSYNHIGGTLLGGAIGHNVSVDRQSELYGDPGRSIERCDMRYRDRYEERIDGYEVTYEYAGRQYVTRMPYDPGERLRVRVDVTPTAA